MKEGKAKYATISVPFGEFANLNVKEEKRWTTKNLTLKSVYVGFEPSWVSIRISTNLLESLSFP